MNTTTKVETQTIIQENKPREQIEQSLQYKELKLKIEKKVTWTEDTVDNEHMNKKKSKSNL